MDRSNRWRTIPVNGVPKYSDEIKELAHADALKAALAEPIEFVDLEKNTIASLGPKWEKYFVSAYSSLINRYGENVDDLILLSDRMDRYTSVYEASLRRRASELEGSDDQSNITSISPPEICGALLTRHFNDACRKELLDGIGPDGFPGTSEVLEALSVNRIMQAALLIQSDVKKGLDLLSDAMAAKFLYTQGSMQLESFYALIKDREISAKKFEDDKKATAKKVAATGGGGKSKKLGKLKEATIEFYKNGKWDSAPLAAKEIQPKIVELSKKIGPQLSDSTIKPLQWIREYKKSL